MEPVTEKRIRELLDVAKAHGLAEVSYQENGFRVAFRRSHKKVRRAAPVAAASQSGIPGGKAAIAYEGEVIRSPMVGTFRRSSSKDHPPFVVEGNHVKPGDRLGIVECMKIPNEVVSYAEGAIAKILVEDGQVVEYGQPLFTVAPKPAAATYDEEQN
jgi:acetyl-CoA carboxylase biotin carboxyl carrier protein